MAGQDPAKLRKELDKLLPMREFGYELPDDLVLDEELHELEPALSAEIRAGFVVPQHWHVRPESFNHGVATAARGARGRGSRGRRGDRLRRRRPPPRRGCGPRPATSRPTRCSSRPAPGPPACCAELGIDLPSRPARATASWSGRRSFPGMRSCSPMSTSAARRSARRCGSGARWSSAASISTSITTGSTRRSPAPAPLFASGPAAEVESEWAGMRPIAPDGLPVIDRTDSLREPLRRDRLLDAGHDPGPAGRRGDRRVHRDRSSGRRSSSRSGSIASHVSPGRRGGSASGGS